MSMQHIRLKAVLLTYDICNKWLTLIIKVLHQDLPVYLSRLVTEEIKERSNPGKSNSNGGMNIQSKEFWCLDLTAAKAMEVDYIISNFSRVGGD